MAGLLNGKRIYLKLGQKRPIVRFKQDDLDALFERRQKGRPRLADTLSIHSPLLTALTEKGND
jgi:hypothetical protein